MDSAAFRSRERIYNIRFQFVRQLGAYFGFIYISVLPFCWKWTKLPMNYVIIIQC